MCDEWVWRCLWWWWWWCVWCRVWWWWVWCLLWRWVCRIWRRSEILSRRRAFRWRRGGNVREVVFGLIIWRRGSIDWLFWWWIVLGCLWWCCCCRWRRVWWVGWWSFVSSWWRGRRLRVGWGIVLMLWDWCEWFCWLRICVEWKRLDCLWGFVWKLNVWIWWRGGSRIRRLCRRRRVRESGRRGFWIFLCVVVVSWCCGDWRIECCLLFLVFLFWCLWLRFVFFEFRRGSEGEIRRRDGWINFCCFYFCYFYCVLFVFCVWFCILRF